MIWSYNPLIRNKGSSTFISINGLLCLGINAKFNHQSLVRELSWIQSHYIKVTQEGVSNRTIQNWLWIEPYLRMVYYVLGAKKNKKIWFLKLILCIFSVQTLKHFQKNRKHEKKCPQKLLKISPNSTAIHSNPCPNHIFCVIKNVSQRHFYIMTLPGYAGIPPMILGVPFCLSFSKNICRFIWLLKLGLQMKEYTGKIDCWQFIILKKSSKYYLQ